MTERLARKRQFTVQCTIMEYVIRNVARCVKVFFSNSVHLFGECRNGTKDRLQWLFQQLVWILKKDVMSCKMVFKTEGKREVILGCRTG